MMERNEVQFPYPHTTSIPKLIAAQAAIDPNSTAVVSGTEMLTYFELNHRADQLGHFLRSCGVGANTLVGLAFDRSPALVIAALGIWKSGGAFLSIDPNYPSSRLAMVLNDARPSIVVSEKSIAQQLPAGPWKTICLDRDLTEKNFEPCLVETHLSDLAYVIYTSGSTGCPKGVQITQGNLLNLILWHQHAFDVSPADRATQYASPGFDAVIWELWPHLTAGASVHFIEQSLRMNPPALRDWIVAKKITISFAPTTIAEQLMSLEWPPSTALRFLLTGADTLHRFPPPELPFAVINNYGPTENTVVATSGVVPPDPKGDAKPSIGRPIANVQIHILDQQLKPVPEGEVGELHISGCSLSQGYLNHPDLTAERFIPSPFSHNPRTILYRTGDLARLLPDGQISFLGRIDHQIKIRGYRIEPEEITTILDKVPGVEASIVMAREDTPGDKRLVAYILPKAKTPLSSGVLLEQLRSALPEHMLPSIFVQLESIPLTANGKLDRAALPAPHSSNTLREGNFEVPRTAIETKLVEILENLLSIDCVGVNDNFFLLGGHSLLGTQLISRIRTVFGVELSLRGIFDAPTVAALSAEIQRLIDTKTAGILMSESTAQYPIPAP